MLVWRLLAEQEWLVEFMRALRATPPGPDGPSPVAFGDPAKVRGLLKGAGFTGVELSGVESPMWYGTDADDACAFVAGHFAGALDALEPDERPVARDALRAVMASHETPDGVQFRSACWLVTARREPERGLSRR